MYIIGLAVLIGMQAGMMDWLMPPSLELTLRMMLATVVGLGGNLPAVPTFFFKINPVGVSSSVSV